MEVVDIDLDTIPLSQDNYNRQQEKPSVSFGGGIELLMNEKRKSSNTNTRVDMDDLDNLEAELNDLSDTTKGSKTISGLSDFGNMFGFGGSKPEKKENESSSSFGLGQATKESAQSKSTTWDGFSKVGQDIPKTEPRLPSNMNEREKRRKKRIMIKKLEEWAEKGSYKHSTSFNMDSNYEEVEDEYEGALEEKRKKDAIKLQGWWFSTVINTLEYGNAMLNPFDLNLEGWGESISDDLDSYEEIFSELHEKYKGGKMGPEVSLLLRIGFSAAVCNMSNKMLSSATPGFNDIMKQSPELMKMFTTAAVDTMSKQNSAFDFAKTMLNNPEEVSRKSGPPPAPIQTQNQNPPPRPGSMQYTNHPGNRPDLAAATNQMFREPGVDLRIQQPANGVPQPRQEMRGPQNVVDINQLLSGLKTKQTVEEEFNNGNSNGNGSESIVTVSSLKDLDGTKMPTKIRRRNKSDKNTVALDI